ncbi:MAG: tRNA lysidine(34) synthetase TilS, partial [Prevotella sp.]
MEKGRLYLVALSGGPDSVALLRVLADLDYQIEAVHCNFRLRGDESDRDEAFCRHLCQSFHVPFHVTHFDTRTYAALHRVSIEMAARELRYPYFEKLRQAIGAAGICVAHHQDDSVETVLMNLLRGTGLKGLEGILPQQGYLIRPLLGVSRSDIEQYLSSIGQDFVI